MKARLRLLLALSVALGSIWTAQLAAPQVVSACSCVASDPADIGRHGDDPSRVVFVGTVIAVGPANNRGHTFGDIRIERLFHGTVPAVARAKGGHGADCTMMLSVGMQMITVARLDDGVLNPGACAPHADPSTAEGRAMIAAAERAYGIGAVLDPGPVTGPPVETVSETGMALPLALGAGAGLALALFTGVVLFARRGRPTP